MCEQESMIAGKQVTKLLGVYRWFEWNGRKFDLAIMCKLLCEPVPDVSEYEKDANLGCTMAVEVIGQGWGEDEMNALLDAHDKYFEDELEKQRRERA